MRRGLALAAAMTAVLCGPPTAQAATLVNASGTLTYTAGAGAQNLVNFDGSGTISVARQTGDDDPIAATGCTETVPGRQYACAGVLRLDATAGDGVDRLTATVNDAAVTLRGGAGNDFLTAGANAPTTLEGGDGDDSLTAGDGPGTLRGGAGSDVLYGGVGSDFLDGGPDRDTLQGNGGADTYRGGDGIDDAFFAASVDSGPTIAITVTINGAADDGAAGEGDNVEADVENLTALSQSVSGGAGSVTLIGSAGPNRLEVTRGIATLDGGGGADILVGGPLDDTIEAADGVADTINCNAGNDGVHADTVDVVADDCERVERVAAPGPAPTPTPTPAAPAKKPAAVRSFKPLFATVALLSGPRLGKLEGIEYFTGLQGRSTVTLRCVSACSRKVRVVKHAGAKLKSAKLPGIKGAVVLRVRIPGSLILRKATRIEVRVAHAGRRTRYVRYRLQRSHGELDAYPTSRGVLSD